MTLTKDSLRPEILIECGSPAPAELANTFVDQKIDDSVVEISKWVHAREARSLVSVESQQSYDLSAVTGLVAIAQVTFPRETSSATGDTFVFPPEGNGVVFEARELYDNPSLWTILKIKDFQQDIRQGRDWTFDSQSKILKIMPEPSAVRTYLYLAMKLWTLATLPDNYREYVVLYASFKCLHALANKRENLAGVNRGDGRRVIYSAGKRIASDGNEKKDEFECKMLRESKEAFTRGGTRLG